MAEAAVPAHPFKEVFGPAAQPQFPSEKQTGITVDQSTGDVYVIELSEQKLLRYKEDGEPLPFSALAGSNAIDGNSGADATPQGEILSVTFLPGEAQVAIAPSTAGASAGDIYVTDAVNGMIDIFAPSGQYLGQKSFGHPCGVAVNSAGTVFVGSSENLAALYKLEATAPGSLTEIAHFPTTKSCQVAAGFGPASGSVFVAELLGPITKFNASTGAEDYKFVTGETGAIASDPATGHVYVANGIEIKEFDAAGGAAVEVTSTELGEAPHGLAVNATTGNIYTGQEEELDVKVYGPITNTLTLTIVGQGEVKCRDQVATSFGPCAASYPQDHTVTLQANAASGSSFEGWSEFTGSGTVTTPCAGAVTECEVKFESNVSGKATFLANPQVTLTVTRSGAGSGTVTSVPSGINCGPACESKYQVGKLITLEAAPTAGSVFQEWDGCDSTVGNVCHVEMTAAKAVGVVFAKASRSLTINKAGNGSGSVACNGGACAGTYPDGTAVTLTATPDSSSTFAGWSGGGCSGTGTCTLTVGSDLTIAAAFDKKSEEHKEESKSDSGGTATVSPSAKVSGGTAAVQLTCGTGAGCKGTVTLKAKVKQGKKQKTVVIGKANFAIAVGQSATVKVKITNSQVKKQLSKGNAVKVQLSGTGIKSSTVTLKPAKPKAKH